MTDKPQGNETRMVPHSIEAEEAVLGSILIDGHALLDVMHYLNPGDFFIVRNEWVFDAMLRVHARGEAIDLISVAEEVRAAGKLDQLGGAAYLSYLVNNTPSGMYADTYGRLVERASIRRGLLGVASAIGKAAHNLDIDIDAVLDQSRAILYQVQARRAPVKDDRAESVAIRAAHEIEAARMARGFVGVPTGLIDLDAKLGGFRKGNLVIVAGRPGMGKTSMLITLALHAARMGVGVGLVSLEMSDTENMNRMIAQETGLSVQQMLSGLSDEQWALYLEAVGRISSLPLFIKDASKFTLAAMEAQAQRWVNEHGIGLLMVDYLQLMVGSAKAENRTQEVGSISRGLKQLARTLNIPVIAAAQLNRGLENRQDKRPMLADLRESGDQEQDADVVMFLYRDEVYNQNTERPNQCDVIIAKHRNGALGTVPLFWHRETMRLTNLKRASIDLSPYSPGFADNGGAQ